MASSNTNEAKLRRSSFPRYLTYKAGELEARLRELEPTGRRILLPTLPTGASSTDTAKPYPSSGNSIGGHRIGTPQQRRQGRILWNHTCTVSFPDGKEGSCAYKRGGPAWHIFRFFYEKSTLLPVQHETTRLANDPASIEEAAKRLAETAYRDAIEREHNEYFRRASECGGRKKRPELFQMKALRAKALAGKYALCKPVGKRLLPVSRAFERIEEANAAWKAWDDWSLVVACCNRLDRCWEIPRFNPLYAEFDPLVVVPEGLPVSRLLRVTVQQQPVESATSPVEIAAAAKEERSAAPQQHRYSEAVSEQHSPEDEEDDWIYLPGPDGAAEQAEDGSEEEEDEQQT